MAFKLGKIRESVLVPIFDNVLQKEAPEADQKRYEAGQLPEDSVYKSFYVTNRMEWASDNGSTPSPTCFLKLKRINRKFNQVIAEQLDGGEALVQKTRRGEPAFARRTISNAKQLEAQNTIYCLCVDGWQDVLDENEKPLVCSDPHKLDVIEQIPGLGDFVLAFCRDPRNFGEDKATQEKKDLTSDATLLS